MSAEFSYTLINGWSRTAVGETPGLIGLKSEERLLLLSSGSMTLDLELLSAKAVEVELKYSGKALLGSEDAAYLNEDAGKEAIERVAWLTVGQKRLVFAHTLIPLDRIQKSLLKALESRAREPIGTVLRSKKIPFQKENIEVGVLRCEQAAADLNIAASTPLVSRRYILFDRKKSGRWTIKALVTEIFSPVLIPFREASQP